LAGIWRLQIQFRDPDGASAKITRLVRELADIVPVALCSGNHEQAGRLFLPDWASVYGWIIKLGTHPNIITDGSIFVFFLVNCLDRKLAHEHYCLQTFGQNQLNLGRDF
jgi:hypothetical protein